MDQLRQIKVKFPVQIFDGKEWKICIKCLKQKQVSEFYKKSRPGNEPMPRCKACMIEQDRQRVRKP